MALPPYSVDVVTFARAAGELLVLVRRAGLPGRGKRELPWTTPAGSESLLAAAKRVARATAGGPPAWLAQVGAFADRRHPSDAPLSVVFVALRPTAEGAAEGAEFVPLDQLPALPPRQRAAVEAARDALVAHLGRAPVAFHLLPREFTLGALQATYELLLDRPLHKASFRRALRAAELVAPVDEWRTEGRGRPAQLFTYAPSKRAGTRRAARLTLDSVA